MKKITTIIILFTFTFYLLPKIVSADNWSDWCMWNVWYQNYDNECLWKKDFELYECRVKNICNPCSNNWSQKLFKTENYEKWENYRESTSMWDKINAPFDEAKTLYRDNMNSIYWCALLDAQERWLKTVKDKLLKVDTTWIIKTNVEERISSQEIKLEAKKSALNCNWKWNWVLFTKKEVLDETTQELCKYIFYLDYLKSYYTSVENISWISKEDQELMWTWTQSVVIQKVWQDFWNMKKRIEDEEYNSYKIFPLAFSAYNEYENNFQLHFILTIIREDYIIVRDLLAKVLWPVNQLVYKIKDCMSLN